MSALTPVEEAIYGRVYPLIGEIESELNQGIALVLWINLTRMLASRGVDKEQLSVLLEEHYDHQLKFNVSAAH